MTHSTRSQRPEKLAFSSADQLRALLRDLRYLVAVAKVTARRVARPYEYGAAA